jgi:hypothetical protein
MVVEVDHAIKNLTTLSSATPSDIHTLIVLVIDSLLQYIIENVLLRVWYLQGFAVLLRFEMVPTYLPYSLVWIYIIS